MSMLHPEEVRESRSCGWVWRAEKYTRLDRQQPVVGIGFTKRAQDLHRESVYERRNQQIEIYRTCGNCGSKKVRTLTGKRAKNTESGMPSTQHEGAATTSPSPPPGTAGPPPGFYKKGHSPDLEWWDGQQWTGHRQPG